MKLIPSEYIKVSSLTVSQQEAIYASRAFIEIFNFNREKYGIDENSVPERGFVQCIKVEDTLNL